jgi:hypothetical protein
VSRAPSLLCGALALVIGSQASFGAERERRPAGRQVDLIIGATASEAQLLEPPIREMLAAKGLEVATARKAAVTAQDVAAAIAPPKEATPPLARALLDFTEPGQATLFLIDPRRGRVYVRRMTLAHGLDPVARASVRFVIEESIDAILEGREIGVSREEFQRTIAAPAEPPPATPPPPPAPAPTPPPAPAPLPPATAASIPPAPATQMLLAAGYQGLALGYGEIQHAATIVLAVRGDRLGLAGSVRVAAPISIAGDGARARLSSGDLALSGTARLLRHGELSVVAGLGGGLEVTRVEPAVTMPTLQAAGAFWASGPWLDAFAAVERLFGRLSVSVLVGAEAHLLAERYAVRTASGTQDVFVPSRIRPLAALLAGVVF